MKNTATGAQASWAAALRRFELDLRRRGAGERIRRAYAADAAELATWAAAQGLEPHELTDRLLRSYPGLVVERKLAAARAFFRSMLEHGDVEANPADGLARPARSPAAVAPVTPLELRDRALFELAGSGRLSAERLAALDVDSVDVGDDGPRAAVDAYLRHGRPALAGAAGDPALFLSKSGLRLSPSDVRRRLRAWTRRAPTAQQYTRIESARLRAAYLRSHPRA